MLYEKIRDYINENGIKANSIAKKLNVSEQTFSAIIRGKRKISAEEYFIICEALNVSLEKFCDDKTA